mmetsp:Transcript_7875/g.5909  ORF Transcript_7875/g.5909 Transcript_7875/m.5909 type:complete len:174 (+) Transcript_7875:53-574(+)
MILYPQDTNVLMFCTGLVALIEFLRIFIGFLISLPSTMKKQSLEVEKLKLQAELSTIKSIQLELVRASKLERGIIKIDKDIQKLKEGQDGSGKTVRGILRGLRYAALVGLAVYLGLEPLVLISPEVLWPFSFFTSSQTVPLQPWFFIAVSSLAMRHFFRTLLPIVSPASASLP